MGARTTYFCDWCGVVSPLPNAIPHAWRIHQPTGCGSREEVCEDCAKALEEGLARIKAQRQALRTTQAFPQEKK